MTSTPSSRFGELPTIELPSFLEFLKLKKFPLKVYPSVQEPKPLTKDTLYVYGPGKKRKTWFDVDCLQIQAYLKFCGIEYDIYPINQPEASPSGKLPFLATVVGEVYDEHQIIHWVKETRKMEKELSSDIEQSKAFITLVEKKLKPALLFSMWLEPLNANEITCKAYYDHLPAPVNHAVFYKKQNEVTKLLLTEKDILVREEIYQDAANALEALSVKLGNDTYFFGSSEPTWVDAVIFSHLHCALTTTITDQGKYTKKEIKQARTLSDLVHRHDNLFNYVKSVNEGWFK
ncbi:hypothetical protein G6F46_011211 [Rhizopus delemar]|nr:hypothetical protein G6F54_007664 [Rhizopus delemar]KAG1501722.1 hypothetical protein G6F53_011020 [Rhizopus delemar]KAG1578885.1 hypothetical protein G6F48_011581 [Rhizopus delemar]KAG1585013.1 hypothetical protein G6F47_011590 [Rhizopus delemar]KAG1608896.1 hypothetical protein G6F46_011211 [Rhizopus delemar]